MRPLSLNRMRTATGRCCSDVENIAVFVVERSPPLTAGAPRPKPTLS
jgi:hypothetical protein